MDVLYKSLHKALEVHMGSAYINDIYRAQTFLNLQEFVPEEVSQNRKSRVMYANVICSLKEY